MTSKRPSVAEGNTPGKLPSKRTVQSTSRRSLFGSESDDVSQQKCSNVKDWTEEEESAIVQYICLFWKNAHTNKWPTTKDMEFWNVCADAVNNTCNSTRTGLSCNLCLILYVSCT